MEAGDDDTPDGCGHGRCSTLLVLDTMHAMDNNVGPVTTSTTPGPSSISSTRCRKDHDRELTRRTPAIYFIMLELEDGGVAPVGDAADIYFVNLEPGGVELAGMPPHAA